MLLCVMVLQIKSVRCEEMERYEICEKIEKLEKMKKVRYYNLMGHLGYVSDKPISVISIGKIFKGFGLIVYAEKIKLINIEDSKIYDLDNQLIIDIQ